MARQRLTGEGPWPISSLDLHTRAMLRAIAGRALNGVGLEEKQEAAMGGHTFQVIRPMRDEEIEALAWSPDKWSIPR